MSIHIRHHVVTLVLAAAANIAAIAHAPSSSASASRCVEPRTTRPHAIVIPDTDHDGVLDDEDLCVDLPAGIEPDPRFVGCPSNDRDHDGVSDARDACPNEAGEVSDPRPGCPPVRRTNERAGASR